MGLFKNIAKWVVTGAGTVLSLINPMLGAPLLVLGSAIKGDTKTTDLVSNAAGNLGNALATANAMTTGANVQAAVVSTTDKTIEWIKNNLVIVIGGILAIVILPKLLFKKK